MAKLTKSIRRGSDYTQGGLSAIILFPTFLANGVAASATYTRDAANPKLITDIALDPSVVPVTLESEIDKANFTDNLTIGAGRYIAQGLGFTLGQVDAEKQSAMEAVDLQYHTAVVRNRAGKCFLLGELNGLVASQNNGGSGSAAGDLNGYETIISGAENGRAPEVSLAAFATLSTLVVA